MLFANLKVKVRKKKPTSCKRLKSFSHSLLVENNIPKMTLHLIIRNRTVLSGTNAKLNKMPGKQG